MISVGRKDREQKNVFKGGANGKEFKSQVCRVRNKKVEQ